MAHGKAKEYTATQKAAAKGAIALGAGALGAGAYMKVARNRNAQNAAAARAAQVAQRRAAGRRGFHAARSNMVASPPGGQVKLPAHPHGGFLEGYRAGYHAFFEEGKL